MGDRARTAALPAVIVALAASTALAHEEKGKDIAVSLDPLPARLAGVRIELHTRLVPQLVLENKTGKVLEILDEAGVPFIRVGPRGVEGNLAAPAWYTTDTPVGTPIPKEALVKGAAPRWVVARTEPSWKWFDTRLRTDDVPVPHAVVAKGRPARVGGWSIPLRFDGAPVTLRGSYRYEPPPSGTFEARLTSPPEIAEEVRVQLMGGRIPGLFLQSASRQGVTVLGADGEPFLEVGPNGVRANARSPTWHRSGQAKVLPEGEAIAPDPKAEPLWRVESTVARIAWVEFRAAYPDREPPEPVRKRGEPAEVLRWEVPVRIGDEVMPITGVTEWIPRKSPTVARSK